MLQLDRSYVLCNDLHQDLIKTSTEAFIQGATLFWLLGKMSQPQRAQGGGPKAYADLCENCEPMMKSGSTSKLSQVGRGRNVLNY